MSTSIVTVDLDSESKRTKTLAHKICNQVPKKLIVSFKNKYRSTWELIPMTLSLYNAITIPLEFSYAINFWFLQANEIINVILDLLFLIDNILMFFTTYENKYGIEIWDHYKIYYFYTGTARFVFDSLSLLGMSLFKVIHPAFKYF